MKTLKFFGMVMMTVLMSVAFVACSSDDDEENSAKALLLGTWQKEDKVICTFNKDNTGLCVYSDEYSESFTYKFNSKNSKISWTFDGADGSAGTFLVTFPSSDEMIWTNENWVHTWNRIVE